MPRQPHGECTCFRADSDCGCRVVWWQTAVHYVRACAGEPPLDNKTTAKTGWLIFCGKYTAGQAVAAELAVQAERVLTPDLPSSTVSTAGATFAILSHFTTRDLRPDATRAALPGAAPSNCFWPQSCILFLCSIRQRCT